MAAADKRATKPALPAAHSADMLLEGIIIYLARPLYNEQQLFDRA